MSGESTSWARQAAVAALSELGAIDTQLTMLNERRATVVASLTPLLDVLATEPDDAESDEFSAEKIRANMRRYMDHQIAVHRESYPDIEPPKRRQSWSSSTMRVLRILEEAGQPWSAGDVVTSFHLRDWAEDPAVITQAIRRNIGYGFVVRIDNHARVYQITDEGRNAIKNAIRNEEDED